ncbi:MAG: response regulator [Chloroflexota bacterium]
MKRTILVVDDDPMFYLLMERVFRPLDFQLASALNIEDGMRLARELKPVLIVMDVYLPGGDGWTTRRIKNELEQVHIVVVSAAGGMVDKTKLAEFKCSGFFKKPFHISEFMAFVKPLLE